jgi:hypothetical protein
MNKSEEPFKVFQEGEAITLEWEVQGEPGTTVELSSFGTVGLRGSKKMIAKVGLQSPFLLIASDSFGSPPIKRGLSFSVVKPEPLIIPNELLIPN